MESGYDENLNENVFFKTLQTTYKEVFHRAIGESWIICVPCSQSLDNYAITESNVLTHILVPSDELPDTHFVSLINEEVTICDNLVRVKNFHSVPILFTEVFYADQVKYEILCVERPLNFDVDENRANPRIYLVKTLSECVDLLTSESTNELAIKKLDEIITQFLFLANKDYFQKSVEQQAAFSRNIYNRCLQIVLMDKKLISKTKTSRTFMENVRISVESYVLHNIHSIVMKGLISSMTEKIGLFNKALRNLASIQLQDLTVDNSVLDSIPKARNELSRFYGYTTVLGKLCCLKRCINLISCKRLKKISVDELLPILVFLVVKSGITTWIAELQYVKEFNFSHCDLNQASESSFLATTLEAVITFIESGMFFKSVIFGNTQLKLIEPDIKQVNLCTYICSRSKLFWKSNNAALLRVFQCIYKGDMEGVESEFRPKDDKIYAFSPVTQKSQFCHPLCSCDRCEKLHTNDLEQTPVHVNSTNESGCSALHVAACYGRSAIVDWLLNRGAQPNAVDFAGWSPLHCAAAHGYQNAVLLLMYADARLDQRDDDGNQPLHFACANGHVDCVKALLYFAEHAGVRLDVNAVNKEGDTPLHLAVRYYYKEVAEILLNYNAGVSIKNKHGRTVFELTHSLGVRDVLNEKYAAVVNLMNVSSSKAFTCISGHSCVRFADNVPLSKDEYGVQPTTAEALKNAEKLFGAVRDNDLPTVKRLLGFDVGDAAGNGAATRETAQPSTAAAAAAASSSSSYKCHPLCQCEKCAGVAQPLDDEFVDDFRKVDALSVNICNAHGVTALHVACKYGHLETIQFLLDAGAKLNARTYKQLLTPLHVACMSNQPLAAKLLLDCNACDMNLRDRRGNTVLHYACIGGNIRLVEVLLKYEPDIEARNDCGKTAINECEENLSYTIMRMLKSPSAAAAKDEVLS